MQHLLHGVDHSVGNSDVLSSNSHSNSALLALREYQTKSSFPALQWASSVFCKISRTLATYGAKV